MSGFIVCGRPLAKKPYYIQEADLNIYSEQELCYYIWHNFMMIDDSFINDRLTGFLEIDLGMDELSRKLRKWKGKMSASRLLMMIMQEVDYYSPEELEEFGRRLEEKDQARPYELLKSRADYMARQKHYPKAIEILDYILDREKEWSIPREVMGKLWHNKGLAQAGMFWMQEAAGSLIRSYELLQSPDILKELFCLRLLEPGVRIPDELSALIPAQQQYRWQEEYEVYEKQAANAPQVRRVDSAMKKDRFRKQDEIERILTEWKQEYREMVIQR